jgi:F-type H+-transporting ATPase subunit b
MVFLLNPADAHFWITLALVVFIIVLWRAKAPGMAAKALDAAAARVRAQLDEAARLRDEAKSLLEEVTRRHSESERAGKEMLAAATADAERIRAAAAIELEEDIRRRRLVAERRIATAEAQAAAQVRAHAADLAADMSQAVLAARIAEAGADPTIDAALADLPRRFG